MDFTRDPIIETIISPKDGYKLSLRNARSVHQEEYLVSALEVVSFGSALFFRSLENPKAFLLPISDYEVVEVKEARMVLKNVSVAKPIKIGEGKSTDDKESSKNDADNKKGSKKRPQRKKRSSAKPTKEVLPQLEENKEVSEKGGEEKDGAEASSSVALPVVPVVLPPTPKIIGRKLPVPKAEEVPQGDVLSDELVSDSERVEEAVAEDAVHHTKEEIEQVKEVVAEETPLEERKEEKETS